MGNVRCAVVTVYNVVFCSLKHLSANLGMIAARRGKIWTYLVIIILAKKIAVYDIIPINIRICFNISKWHKRKL